MAIIHLFHGTSYQAFENIKTTGFGYKKETIWSPSDIDKTYMYELKTLCEVENQEDLSEEDQIRFVSQRANESAQVAQCFYSPNSTQTIVFEFLVDDEQTDFMDYVTEDDSCEGMEGAFQVDNDILDTYLKEGKIKAKVHIFPFYPKFWAFYIAPLYKSSYLEDKLYELSYVEKEALEAIRHSDYSSIFEEIIYVEEEYCMELFF